MSTIDHRNVANNHLSRAAECAVEMGSGREPELAYLATAQVHATLALVEQQRIANQIAFVTATGGMWANLRATLADKLGLS